MPETAPYGSWRSPITASDVARHDGRPGWVGFVGDELWWTEPRPTESGRVALCRRRVGSTGVPAEVVLPPPWSVRSRVIEYGGQAWHAVPTDDGPLLVFSNFADQRLYAYQPDLPEPPRPLTPQPERAAGLRFAEPTILVDRGEVWCVRETFIGGAPTDVIRDIVAIPLDGSAARDASRMRAVVRDRHFVTCPRLAPDGSALAWIGWNHPSMPWDGTELRVASLTPDGVAERPYTLAGGDDLSLVQAEWADPETLYVVMDEGGWWNPHRVSVADGRVTNLYPAEEEFGGGAALWYAGQRWFAVLADGRLAMLHGRGCLDLGLLRPETSELTPVTSDYTEWAAIVTASPDGRRVAGIAASPTTPYEVIVVTVDTGEIEVVRPAVNDVDAGYLPSPRARTFAGVDGRDVHASVYPPRNKDFVAPAGELPPYAVFVHGGPTSRAPMVYDLEIAYFTSRGIGVIEVNYGGSTGYGREYRDRLRENWGVVDVEDCASAVRALAEAGEADPERLAVRGGSAGGWTSAVSLADDLAASVYRCAAIMYPILDLAGWRTGETHDFESQYLESLVGPWPETKARYESRSVVSRTDRVRVPFVLFQGLDDVICPPAQAERFLASLAGRGVPHRYLTFEGEQHGFRRDSTVIACLEAELALYARVFGFDTDAPALELE